MGPRIRELREAKMLTQLELAQRAGITPLTVSRIELGKQVPSIKTVK